MPPIPFSRWNDFLFVKSFSFKISVKNISWKQFTAGIFLVSEWISWFHEFFQLYCEKKDEQCKTWIFHHKVLIFRKNRKQSFVLSLTKRCSCIIKRYTSFYTFPIWDRDTFLKKHTGWFGISGLQMHIAWMSIDRKINFIFEYAISASSWDY